MLSRFGFGLFVTTALVFAVLGVVDGRARAQDRQDTYVVGAVQVRQVELWPLADGGCRAQWCGYVSSLDGGSTIDACTGEIDLRAAANQNRCEALLSAGVNRVARALRMDVDGGTP